MKKSIFKLGKELSNNQQKEINGGQLTSGELPFCPTDESCYSLVGSICIDHCLHDSPERENSY